MLSQIDPQHQQQRQLGDGRHLLLHNPFTLRIGQVMTGFGIGCGVGIGVGRPFNLRAVPVLGPIAGEAVSSFASVGHQVQGLIRRLGIKNLQAGIGCGVGFGHGFGIGVTLKPGAAQQLKLMMEQGYFIVNERIKSVVGNPHGQESTADISPTSPISPFATAENPPGVALSSGDGTNQTGSGLGRVLQNPSPVNAMKSQLNREAQILTDGEVDRLQAENKILRTLLTHQEQIEELKKQNAALQQALAEKTDDSLEIRTSLEASHSMEVQKGRKDIARGKCLECRRRSRQRS